MNDATLAPRRPGNFVELQAITVARQLEFSVCLSYVAKRLTVLRASTNPRQQHAQEHRRIFFFLSLSLFRLEW